MLTVNDIIHLIQYYYHHSSYDNAAQDVERFRLEMLREIEQTLRVPQPPLISIEPLRPLFDACQLLIETHARRLPLLDYDEQTGMEAVVSVLTQYRVLKFIAMNCRETAGLNRTLRSLGIGTYVAGTPGVGGAIANNAATGSARGSIASSSRRSSNAAAASGLLPPSVPTTSGLFESAMSPHGNGEMLPSLDEGVQMNQNSPAFESNSQFFSSRLAAEGSSSISNKYDPIASATLDTTVFDVVHVFSEKGISAVPILDEEGYVVDMYETVDVIDLVRSGAYQSLDLTIRQALSRRSKEFPGVMTCGPDDTLATIFTLLRTQRVHRLLILEPETKEETDPFDVAEWQESGEAAKEKPNDPLAGLGEIKHRKKGKLVGILCLSDVLRYIIGGKASLLDPPLTGSGMGATANTSASASAVGDAETTNTTVEGEPASQQDEALGSFSPTSVPNVESGPRPPDLPPTIIEHPKEQQAADIAASEGTATSDTVLGDNKVSDDTTPSTES
jgi:5'-AMP-activated protein kinase regulatory gamma subunit